MKFFKTIYSLFICQHDWIDKCGVKLHDGSNWQDICSSKRINGDCKTLSSYCDFYYRECSKCGAKEKLNSIIGEKNRGDL